jgi:hypothetical protein
MRNATITTVNLTTFTKRVIAKLGNTFWIHKPLWSPDSSQILYVNQNASTFAPEVWVMAANGAHRRLAVTGGALTHRSLEGFEKLAPQWSADGKSILFYDSAYKPTGGWLVSLATGARMSAPSPNMCVYGSQKPGSASLPRLCGSGGGICCVPVYYQNNQTWSNNLMYGKVNGNVVSASIGSAGCALTSLTMLFDYNGSTVGNPGGMNNCLSPWYDAYPLQWYNAQVNPPNGPGCDKYTTNWIQQVGFSWSTLDSYLRSGWPVILGGCWDAQPAIERTGLLSQGEMAAT